MYQKDPEHSASNTQSLFKDKVEIPRSMAGDRGRYFLLSVVRDGNVLTVLHERVGIDSVDYTQTQINCDTSEIKDIGYSPISEKHIEAILDGQWYELVDGSSKSDLVNFVCKNY